MISTTQARNGFYIEILPMALSSRTATTSALCNALLSIAAFHHLGRAAALPYKMRALSQLSHSVSASAKDSSPEDLNTQLGACLMLCMYSVRILRRKTILRLTWYRFSIWRRAISTYTSKVPRKFYVTRVYNCCRSLPRTF